MKRRISPEVMRTALAQAGCVPPAPPSILRVIIDAIETGHGQLELKDADAEPRRD